VSNENVFESEADVKRAVKRILDRIGAFYFMPPSGAFGRTGISDFIGVHRGKFFAIETKFGRNPVTAMQMRFGMNVQTHGGVFMVVNETNLEDVQDLEVIF
jgi:hypothetical protein